MISDKTNTKSEVKDEDIPQILEGIPQIFQDAGTEDSLLCAELDDGGKPNSILLFSSSLIDNIHVFLQCMSFQFTLLTRPSFAPHRMMHVPLAHDSHHAR